MEQSIKNLIDEASIPVIKIRNFRSVLWVPPTYVKPTGL